MNQIIGRLLSRRSLARAVVTLLFVGAALAAHAPGAHAALAGCRSDPLVTVDGQTIQIIAVSSTGASSIARVHYDLHLPASTDESSVRFVGDSSGIPEDATFYYDQPDGQMLTYTTVVANPAVAFAVSVTIRSQGSDTSATGAANQPVAAPFTW